MPAAGFGGAELSVGTFTIEHMFEGLASTELVLAIADSQRQESMLVSKRLAAVAELAPRTAEVGAGISTPAT